MKEEVILGDSLEKLKDLESESVDLLCTDPPYGYSFMGKSWDKTLPDIGIFKECLRVLKPGAFAFVMSAPRSDVCARMMLLLEDAGFNIGFTPIYWTYASGFPKAMNIGKMVDKRAGVEREITGLSNRAIAKTPKATDYNGTQTFAETAEGREASKYITAPATPEAKALDGSYGGFQPKPAVEVVIVAMKPLSEKTYVDQALKNGKGITWLDDCRVPTGEQVKTSRGKGFGGSFEGGEKEAVEVENSQGRFPANLLVEDNVLGDHSRYFALPFLVVPKAAKSEKNAGLTEERVSQKFANGTVRRCAEHDKPIPTASNAYTCGCPIAYERIEKQVSAANHHPTVKPLKLMSYLITLGSRPGDVVLDPFLGSGSTAIAAKQLGRGYIGIEREEEYIKIAEARIKSIPNNLPL